MDRGRFDELTRQDARELSPAEHRELERLCDAHPGWAAERLALDDLLATWADDAPAPDQTAAIMARIARDAPAQAPSNPPRRGALSFSWRWLGWAAPLAAAAVALAVGLGWPREGVQRDRGGPAPGLIDLQVVVEQGWEAPELSRGEDPVTLGPDDGLIFWFVSPGGGYLSLMERDPEHRLRLLHTQALPPRPAGEPMPLRASPQGPPLRYTPDGPSGAYTYLAILGEAPLSGEPASLDRAWEQWARLGAADPLAAEGLSMDGVTVRFNAAPPAHRGDGDP